MQQGVEAVEGVGRPHVVQEQARDGERGRAVGDVGVRVVDHGDDAADEVHPAL